ncbi:acylamino-acid-releasing enzyme [Apiospora sp. TS-2023a]
MSASAADKASIQELLDIECPLALNLSPDCNSVIYVTRLKWYHKPKGSSRVLSPIWIADMGIKQSARHLTDGLYNDRMPQWSPQGSKIAFLSDRVNDSGKSAALYLLDLGTATPSPITPVENERAIPKFTFSPDGNAIAYMTTNEQSEEAKARKEASGGAFVWGQDWEYTRLKLVDIETGEIKTISDDRAHVVDFCWGSDSSKLAVITHQTPHPESHYVHGATISTVDIASGEAKVVAHVPGSVSNITWAQSSLFFLANNIPSQGTSGLAVYSVSRSEGFDADQCNYERLSLGLDCCLTALQQVGSDTLVKTEKGLEDELWLLSQTKPLVTMKKAIRQFDAGRAPDGGIAVALALGDVNNPTEVFSSLAGSLVQLSDHGRLLSDKSFGCCSFVSCKSADGKETLQGVHLVPSQFASTDGRPTKPLPTFVLLHGGPYARRTDSFEAWDPLTFIIPILLRKGFAVLMPNYRGSSGRGQRFASYSRGGMGTYDEPDVVSMTQHLASQGWADKDRLVVGGWSQGGYLSYLSAVRNGAHGLGWRFRGAICGAGVTDWDTMAMTSDIGYEQAQYAGGAPWAATDKRNVSSRSGSAIWEFQEAAEAKRIPPLLILHGQEDQRVPVSQAHGFRRALDQAGLMHHTEFVTYPKEGHHFTERKHVEDIMERMVSFVNRHLLA